MSQHDDPPPAAAPDFELFETWRSQVYLTRSDVWKVKKPVRLGHLDYTTLEARRNACQSELALNAALAPDVYLGVTPVTEGPEGRRCFGRGPEWSAGNAGNAGAGREQGAAIIDWAVHMARLPDADRLDARLRAGRIDDDDVRAVARAIAAFHQLAPRIDAPGRDALDAVIRLRLPQAVQGGSTGTAMLPPEAARAEHWQREFLERNAALFEERDASGRVRDGHGDLGLDHVFIDGDGDGDGDGERVVRVIDRLEFAAPLRYFDVAADVAQLAAELAVAGRADLAERFLAAYAMEANDFDLYPLVDFYASLRASLRGRIEWYQADHFAHDPLRSEERRARALRFFQLATAARRRPLLPPVVVAMGGLVASGKSTVARCLGNLIGAPVVGSDRTREFMLGAKVGDDIHEAHWERAYESGFGKRVYDEVIRRAGAVLRSGRPVVIDGCFRSADQRARARALAAQFGHPFFFVEAQVPEELHRERLRARSLRDGEPESTWRDIASDLRSQWEPADELPPGEHVKVDTSISIEDNAAALRERLATWPLGLRD